MPGVSAIKKSIFTSVSVLVALAIMQPAPAEPLTSQRRDELINMVKHDCGSCHGLTLHGGLGPPLTTDALAGKPHELLVNAIKLGRDHTAMPPWDGLLTRKEIDWLVQVLKRGMENTSEISSE